MARSASLTLSLEESGPQKQPAVATVRTADLGFLLAVATILVGGCVLLLMLGAARSGHPSSAQSAFDLSALLMKTGKYAMLLLGSVVNSALMVVLVHFLRVLDRKITHYRIMNGHLTRNVRYSRFRPRPSRAAKKRVKVEKKEKAAPTFDSSGFLLSPVFR